MEDLSEAAIRANCPHCSVDSQAFTYLIDETANFRITCDAHLLETGHILVIPKEHLSCVGEYSLALLEEFKALYAKVSAFVRSQYGSVATFEHGIFGQTVFHSHIHFLPFTGNLTDIVPEGETACTPFHDLSELQRLYQDGGGYLFLSINDDRWTVNPVLAAPRFFRDRFAAALGHPERGSWKDMRQNPELMETVAQENQSVQQVWADRPR